MTRITSYDLSCPECQAVHIDLDEWALRSHKTHLCLVCGHFFEAETAGVSNPTFEAIAKPDNVLYTPTKPTPKQ